MSIEVFPSSGGGGTDWSKKTGVLTYSHTSGLGTNVIADVTGSGYFMGLTQSDSTSDYFDIQIDGSSTIYRVSVVSALGNLMIRFNTSFKITHSADTGGILAGAVYVLD